MPRNGQPAKVSPWSIHDCTVIESHSRALGAVQGLSSGTVSHLRSIAMIASPASTAPVGVSVGTRPEYVAARPPR
jgi:hypothetical protein